ncbi:hypothetical protein TcasGA2_TC031970 [Tribolium castaneum]|uniref:Peptidase A2 domain-containing protein n=1 Tax=Tribolium castaneum TaxID=7070 RepID=A0A139WNQ7_TRICA|nr:hypothetical protein TcasGA2_TC031970 [Tribolium castaneum]
MPITISPHSEADGRGELLKMVLPCTDSGQREIIWAHVDPGEGTDVYEAAVSKLNEYFYPKQSKIYERHIFRLTKQEPGEEFEKFLVRLRNQAAKCKFTNVEEHLIDQIVEKSTSSELRKKILSAGDNTTLDIITAETNALEAVKRQLEDFVDPNPKTLELNYISRRKECTRCGGNHLFNSPNCPAKRITCMKCGYREHYQKFCKTKPHKRQDKEKMQVRSPERKRTKYSSKTTTQEDVDYVFQIDDDSTIQCNVGGVAINMLIDSGSKSNIIYDQTWQLLKEAKINVWDQIKNPEKLLFAYENKTPLKVLGSFKSSISVGSNSETATFYVIQNGSRCLLGKTTSIALGVLKIGLEVNVVDQFPKFKNVVVDIPIDESVKPICQPYKRIPIPLEAKVDKKLEELIESDIIEAVNEPARKKLICGPTQTNSSRGF